MVVQITAFLMGSLSAEGTCNDFEGAIARALKCSSREGYDDMLLRKAVEFPQRFFDAYRRLFAEVGLDFDTSERAVLFDAFVTMVNQLPDYCLNWFRLLCGKRVSTLI